MLIDRHGNLIYGVSTDTEMMMLYRAINDDISITTAHFCRMLIANSVSKLPLVLYKETSKGRKEIAKANYPAQLKSIAKRPNDIQTWPEFIRSSILNTLDYGNAYGVALINQNQNIATLLPIVDPVSVVVNFKGGRLFYNIPQSNDFGLNKNIYFANEVMHIKALNAVGLKGYGVVALNKTAFKIMQRAEQYGVNHFEHALSPTGLFEFDPQYTPEQYQKAAKELINAHQGVDNAGKSLFLKPGIKFTSISANNQASQYIETREFQKREIMAAYGVPYAMIDTGGGYDAAQLAFYKDTVFSYCRAFEDALNRLCPDGFIFELDTEGFIKGSPQQQIDFVSKAIQSGTMTINEGRVYMGRDPVEGGDVFSIATNNQTLGSLEQVIAIQEAQRQSLLNTTSNTDINTTDPQSTGDQNQSTTINTEVDNANQ
ncbi:phage portal protein [Aeromonas veronii]